MDRKDCNSTYSDSDSEYLDFSESKTVFVIMLNSAGDKFCVAKDKSGNQNDFYNYNKKKFPGGGAENQETLEEAALREAEEETGQKVTYLTPLLIIHKSSRNNPLETHSDIFFLSSLLEHETPLAKGDEIEELSWKSEDEIMHEIHDDKFHANHASAFLWYKDRDEYLKNRNDDLLIPILFRESLRVWKIEGNTLILCYHKHCRLCRVPAKPGLETQTFSGEIKIIAVYHGRFEDKIFLKQSKERSTYKLPTVQIGDETKPEAIMDSLPIFNGNLIDSTIMKSKDGNRIFVLAQINTDKIPNLEAMNLNTAPDFFLEDDQEWKDIYYSIIEYTSKHKDKRIEINRTWLNQKNPPKMSII